MKLEKQVCSLEISKRLKELGAKQESFVTWVQSTECYGYKNHEYKLVPFNEFYGAVHDYWAAGKDSPEHPMFSAFTVAELGEMLPQKLSPKLNGTENSGYFDTILGSERCIVSYIDYYTTHAITEADARGKILIYLLENNLI